MRLDWRHPWLTIERLTRLVIGYRLEQGPSELLDALLLAVMHRRQETERAGWFN